MCLVCLTPPYGGSAPLFRAPRRRWARIYTGAPASSRSMVVTMVFATRQHARATACRLEAIAPSRREKVARSPTGSHLTNQMCVVYDGHTHLMVIAPRLLDVYKAT